MKLTFQINYRTEYGQTMCVKMANQVFSLNCHGQDFWTGQIERNGNKKTIHYSYAIRMTDGSYMDEGGEARTLTLNKSDEQVIIRDFWRAVTYEKVFYTTAFLSALFHRQGTKSRNPRTKTNGAKICFAIDAPQVLPSQGVAVIGNIPELGNWNVEKKLVLDDIDFPHWHKLIATSAEQVIEYKYCIYDLKTGKVVDLEWGENRQIWGLQTGNILYQNDRDFRRTQPRWKGSGVAVPVFSLRTNDGFGIGEFLDLKKMADWASLTGQKIIQTLPINDTTLTHTNTDSYPYNAVSVFALHPIYINIPRMGKLTLAQSKKYEATKQLFNQKKIADYQCVYNEKMKYFLSLYKQYKEDLFASEEYQIFFHKNQGWLEPYASFLHKRDKHPIAFYYFLQFHADQQLTEAVAYAHSLGIAIKGDIPIGISPDSVDADIHPELFNLDASAGAPPDDFSISGQNWGFPTYNWERMQQDHFLWWRQRFQKMQDYFDAYRIDHILGFFRIWQMRKTDVWGLCGHFNPALPYSLQELWNMGVKLDADRMTKPYIRSTFLGDVFGYDTEYAKRHFLLTNDQYVYYFREEFDTQQKVQLYFESGEGAKLPENQRDNLMHGLLYLHCEVLFVRDQTNDNLLHPRISMAQSHTFQELYDDQKQIILSIYNDYFFHRHNDFWRESAMKKLPTLIASTSMLCCGEDLGMVPDCVPDVMHSEQILSLEIQRMPKNPSNQFGHPANAPYLSVCTTGTHDTNPLRAWWEEDQTNTQLFYNQQMGYQGEAPKHMSGEIARFIVKQHMYSPAMWVILPLQDWLAIDEDIRMKNAIGERINVPANPHHFWNYRMHISLEDLMQADSLNTQIRQLTSIR